ncbi:MAG: helix-turn-helix domain-containing protein [Candidatus Obscuribacter sp.]|jgi:excisionase family DNA binding protein|nr:helix-turn-helix domain-containing protein [Candidatus Obscuribacter sp.]MBK9618686.1 helix-turn-helix domain-containing protein [Candidatus Obscuribacter sp.]MBK9770015.1 helix-turn-helix domain-containing protein [Candidatus Obscuribacter sp.]
MTNEYSSETNKSDKPLVTDVAGFASAVDISKRTAWSIIHKRQIPHIRIGRSVKITLTAIDDFLQKRTIASFESGRES